MTEIAYSYTGIFLKENIYEVKYIYGKYHWDILYVIDEIYVSRKICLLNYMQMGECGVSKWWNAGCRFHKREIFSTEMNEWK